MGEWTNMREVLRAGRCATEGCGFQPIFRFEAGGVASNYCASCKGKIERLPASQRDMQEVGG